MKAVVLAGGLGTRLSEETQLRPKPMVEVGGRPLLWHIMKTYSAHGVHDFVVATGYLGYVVKEYFAHYFLHTADVTFDLKNDRTVVHRAGAEPWSVTCVDTGADTGTGGRLRRVAHHLDDETFCLTYGDAVADVDVGALVAFHRAGGRAATVTAVRPPGRFGELGLAGEAVERFREKPADGGWVSGGFFVLEPAVLDLVDDDACMWEAGPLERLTASGQLQAYRHTGYWHSMDTQRDRIELEEAWAGGRAPWKTW